MSYLACFKTDDGTTLFTRSCNDFKLSLGLETSLNTLFAFGVKHDAKMHSADSENYKIIWKMYDSNITLVLIEKLMPIDERVYFNKIDLLYDGIVFMYGTEDIKTMNSSEKFKKEIKICYQIIDSILDINGRYDLLSGLTRCFDSYIMNDLAILQNKLDESLVQINTSYGALFFNGRIVIASNSWWQLNPNESYLISLLCLTTTNANCRDIPIYLPYKNSNQALRLLTYNLTDNVVICFICSDKPSVDFVETNLVKTWHPIYQLLVNLKQFIPRNLPNSLVIDKNIIAFLLINRKLKCCYSSLFPNEQTSPTSKLARHRFELLKDCYLNISTNFFRKNFKGSLKIGENEYEETTLTSTPEAYTLIKNIKCYALNELDYEFYALYNSTIPTYAIRGTTKSCFNSLITFLINANQIQIKN